MNDYADLTDALVYLIEQHTGDFGTLVDLDAWSTDDLYRVIEIVEQVINLRCNEEVDDALFEIDD